MMLRTMWCRNALASKSKCQYAPRCSIAMERNVFTGLLAWHSLERNELKSCSPIRCRAASRMGSSASSSNTQPTRPVSIDGRTGEPSNT